MTGADPIHPPAAGPAPKEPPPLSARAPQPRAIRLRKSVVQAMVIGGAGLVSASLAWAFVIQPELRDSARARKLEGQEAAAHGVVRPAEAVTDQPASYDRLPEPRMFAPAGRGEAEAGTAGAGEGSPRPVRAETPAAPPAGPSPRLQAIRSSLFFADSGTRAPSVATGAGPTQPQDQAAVDRAIPDAPGLTAPRSPFELQAGAMLPAALLTAVDTARAGPVIAIVTQNVYDSVSGRHLLVPQGARLIGRSEGESAYGDRRAFVVWDRLILPNGKSLALGGEAGVDAQGAVGLRGEVDRRLLPLVVGTLFAGAITTLGQAARDGDDDSGGLLGDAGDAAAIQGARTGGRLVDRELQVRPSIRLRAGAPVRVLITRDVVLEPWRP